jgi:hypothetical protein
MKLPVYFEVFGSIGITVSFVAKTTRAGKPYHGTVSMLLAECPEKMRLAVMRNPEHFTTRNSGYELKNGEYLISEPIKV